MLLRLLAFAFFIVALGALAGDAWQSYRSGHDFYVRSVETLWLANSPSTLEMAQRQMPAIKSLMPFPAPAVFAILGALVLLPTIFLRQRH